VPSEDPQVCELWETTNVSTGRPIRAVVADVAPNLVTFVSLTGNRVAVPSTRLSEWAFVQRPPTNGMGCSRRSCRLAGVLRLDRGTTPEWVCPRHMPLGTQAVLDMSSGPSEARSVQAAEITPCPSCGAPETRLAGTGQFNLWDCSRCNYVWATVPQVSSLSGEDEDTTPASSDWYYDQLNQILQFVRDVNQTSRRIDLDPTVWAHLFHDRGSELVHGQMGMRAYRGIPILVLGSESTVPITIQTRDLGRSTSMPVSRLGGQPGRSRTPGASNSSLLDFIRSEQTRIREEPNIRSGVLVSSNSRTPPEEVTEEADVPTAGSLWINRSTGDLVEVVSHSTGAFNIEAVVFRRVSGTGDLPEPQSTMLWDDFLSHHQLRSISPAGPEPTILPGLGEEWEHVDHTEIEILSVDTVRQTVSFVERNTKRRRSISLHDFSSGDWRKIVRRTSFEHIMDDEF
jgi:hypothetical protein